MKEKNINLEWKTLSEVKDLLKSLKLYKDLTNKLWNRWKRLFSSLENNTSIYKVEYFEWASKDDALSEALITYDKVFWEKPSKDDIILESKKTLEWGIRVFKDDNLVDLSFKKASETLK